MKKEKFIYALSITFALMLVMLLAGAKAAADPGPLVSTDWLAKNLKSPGVVVLDVRTFTKYEKSHIPGAIKAFGPWMTMNENFVGFMMPKVSDLERMLRLYGVNNDSFVIVYDNGITAEDTTRSARALWTLHVLGHKKVVILDGGFAAWDQADLPKTNEPTVPTRYGNFRAKLVRDKIATLDEVKKKLRSKKVVFVDTRLPMYHFGHEKKPHILRYGHLPGSRMFPSDYVTNAGHELSPSFMKTKQELAAMAKGVGIPANKKVEIITYSDHGQSAALIYFVLHEILGYKNVKVFDGSILEAAADSSVPMERYCWGYKTK